MDESPGSGRDPFERAVGRARKRIQRRLYRNLKRVPGITDVRFEESGTGIGRQIRGAADTRVFASGVIPDGASLQVNWWPRRDSDPNRFQIHYADGTGFDCGWHRQENDHVDGLDHYQQRESPEEEYTYEPVTFESNTPVGILWEVVDERLVERLQARYG